MKKNKWFLFSLVLFFIPLALNLIFYSQLPDTIAVHFDINGNPDGFMSKPWALFGILAFLVGLHVFCCVSTLNDPKKNNIPDFILRIILMICPVTAIIITGIIVSYSLGYPMNTNVWVGGILGFLFILLGNYLPKVQKNYTVGIKTPWSLDSEENWNRSNRLGGYCLVVSGFIFIFGAFFHQIMWGIIFVIASSILVLVYSFYLHKKEFKKTFVSSLRK